LHIAVVNKNIALARSLLQQDRRLLLGRAVGHFFHPTKPMGLGEVPLSFAACTNQREMVEVLLDAGADMCDTDTAGNTVFHHLMRKENLTMFDFLVDCYHRREERGWTATSSTLPWDIANASGMTPFTYSAYLGSEKMFCALLERRHELQWKYGSVTCYLYPLDDLDTPLIETGNRKPALHWIVHNEHLDLLRQTRIAELLRKKWDRFAERIFLRKLFFTLFYLLAFSLSSILRPSSTEWSWVWRMFSNPLDDLHDPSAIHSVGASGILSWIDHFRGSPISILIYYFAELTVFLGALNKGWNEANEMSRLGLSAYWKCSGALFVENFSSTCYVIVLFLSYALEVTGLPGVVVTRSIAGLLAYIYMLFFFLGFRLTGPFIVIVGRMASVDLVRFFLLFSVFLFGYSQAFYVLFEDQGVLAFVERIRLCFMVILGEPTISRQPE
jgi:hypothetical protein